MYSKANVFSRWTVYGGWNRGYTAKAKPADRQKDEIRARSRGRACGAALESMRRRLSLGPAKKKDSVWSNERRSSLSIPLKAWVSSQAKKGSPKMDWVKRSLAAAAVAVDKATKDLFLDDYHGDDGMYDMLCMQRVQGQFSEFEAR